MIKRIFNWTLCSFFRTLGRFLFYVVVAILVYFVVGNWQVHAKTLPITGITSPVFEYGNYQTINLTTTHTGPWYEISTTQSHPINSVHRYTGTLNFSDYTGNYRYITFYGYSSNNETVNAMAGSDSVCENIAITSSNYPSNNSGQVDIRGYVPFAFRCTLESSINSFSFRIFTNPNSIDGISYYPRIWFHERVFISNSASDNSELLEQQVLNQEQIIKQNDQSLKNQEQQLQQQQQTNNKLDDLNDNLTNSDIDGADDNASQWADKSLSDNVVSGMVTMPITLLRAYLNGMTSSCSSFYLGNFFGTDLTLPCINIQSYFGSLWNIIDVLFSGFMILALGKKFVKIFNDFTNLKDNQVDELYGGGN